MEKVGVSDSVTVLVDQLRAEHATLDARVQELEHHISLTSDEQIEITRLKKMKLATKDRIAILSKRGHA
ncbi:MAG TPA: YdcH family protein [Polyangia bacterium]|nr:YdcH family protein [Polyangia bacterium]